MFFLGSSAVPLVQYSTRKSRQKSDKQLRNDAWFIRFFGGSNRVTKLQKSGEYLLVKYIKIKKKIYCKIQLIYTPCQSWFLGFYKFSETYDLGIFVRLYCIVVTFLRKKLVPRVMKELHFFPVLLSKVLQKNQAFSWTEIFWVTTRQGSLRPHSFTPGKNNSVYEYLLFVKKSFQWIPLCALSLLVDHQSFCKIFFSLAKYWALLASLETI